MAPLMDVPNEADYQTLLRVAEALEIEHSRYDIKQSSQIADLDTRSWVVVPADFTREEYDLHIAPGRLKKCPAVERVGIGLGLKYENSTKDTLGRYFVGWNNWEGNLRMNLALGNITPSVRQFRHFGRLLDKGRRGKRKVFDVSGRRIEPEACKKYFSDTFEVGDSWRSEYLDDDFKVENGKLYDKSNHVWEDGELIPQTSTPLSRATLTEDRAPGISLDGWLKSSTKQGLPTGKTESGDLYYWSPRSNNNSVAGFNAGSDGADLDCGRNPACKNPSLGVRAARAV